MELDVHHVKLHVAGSKKGKLVDIAYKPALLLRPKGGIVLSVVARIDKVESVTIFVYRAENRASRNERQLLIYSVTLTGETTELPRGEARNEEVTEP